MSRRWLINIVISLGLIAGLLFVLGQSSVIADEPASQRYIETVVAANTEFAFDLYARLKDLPAIKKADGNLFFSPYSISTALAMTCAGARGQTQEQMERVLHFYYPLQRIHAPNVRQKLHEALGLLQNQFNKDKEAGYELNVANALWGQKDYGFLESFLEFNKKHYGTGFNEVDFARQTEKARKTINAWIEKQTKNKIKDLIGPGDLKRLTRLVLTNAIYFKGDWASKFKKAATKDAAFHISEERTVQVPLMYQKGKFAYSQSDDAQILVLPYKGDELSMIIMLPGKGKLVASVERNLTTKNLNPKLARLRKREVRIYLPRFKITTETLGVGDILEKMGMKDAFSPLADFSGMTGNKELFISKVLHKAFVEVNEEGTEAAAATAVIMNKRSLPRPVPVFRADRPFIFMIRDNRSQSILFMGRVMNPAIKGS